MTEITVQEKIPKIVTDGVLLLLVFLPIPIFRFAVYPFKRGFYCGDETISYPYKPDTITTAVLFAVGISLPLIGIIVGELLTLRFRKSSLPEDTFLYTSACGSKPIPKKILEFLVTFYKVFGAFGLGCVICQTSTDIIKYSIGRLRPHFFDVCKPDWSRFNCTNAYGQPVFITGDYCTGDDAKKLREARLSHPSGHSSFGCYCMVYLALYIYVRLRRFRYSKVLRPFLMAVVLYMALYTCCSRVSDNKHHWQDVVGGAILGTTIALLVAVFISNLFKKPTLKDLSDQLDGMLHKGQNDHQMSGSGYEL